MRQLQVINSDRIRTLKLSAIPALVFGLTLLPPANGVDISISVSPANPFVDTPVSSSGGTYQVDVDANGGDPVVQLYSGAAPTTFNSGLADNPANHVNENDDFMSVSSRITGTVNSGVYTIRVTSYAYWVNAPSPTRTFILSYIGFTSAAAEAQAAAEPEPALPIPERYFTSLTPPKINAKDKLLICNVGTYRAGYALPGELPTHGEDTYNPSKYVYSLLFDNQPQNSLALSTSDTSATWDLSSISVNGTVTCSVTTSYYGLTRIDNSTGNTEGLSAAKSLWQGQITQAKQEKQEAFNINSKLYQQALIEDRAKWRADIESIRADYAGYLVRTQNRYFGRAQDFKGQKLVEVKPLVALQNMIAAQRRSTSDYHASKPAALLRKDAADALALDAENAAIGKANLTYGTFIESIGYGVLIP
jgi:hypothetical protein